jgi:uncharacterized membrane protein YoaK (UPF0700 family)
MAQLSIDKSRALALLPLVLSLVAGSCDIIGFLGLGGLFTAHITGNVVVLAARLVAGEEAPLSYLLAVPVFMAVLVLVRLLSAGLERIRTGSLLTLLLLQLVLLAAFLAMCLAAGARAAPNSAGMIFAGMLGVSAMAVQNALVRISLTGAPSTAVMTTNVTVFAIDVGELLLGGDPNRTSKARERARRTWPAIVGFILGCAVGAACERALGLHSLLVPIGLAAIALGLGIAAKRGLQC